MGIIARSAEKIKAGLLDLVSADEIVEACLAAGHEWRDSKLNPVTTVRLFLKQILHGNTSCTHVRQLGAFRFTGSGYCQARQRVPEDVFRSLLRNSGQTVRDCARATARWHGHRVWLVDGSSFSMSDTPDLRRLFDYPANQKPGCGFPTAHVLAIFDLLSGALVDMVASPWRTHDMAHAADLGRHYEAGDVLVGDRAFCSYSHLWFVQNCGADVVFRAHQGINISFKPRRPHSHPQRARTQVKGRPRSRWIEALGDDDQIVEWIRPAQKPTWLSQEEFNQLPKTMPVRELRYTIHAKGNRSKQITIVTTLLDPKTYSKAEIARLYNLRWQVETNLKHLKHTMRMDVLRCQTVDGVLKELMMFGVAYNAVRLVMLEAGHQQRVAPDRISFVDVLRWIDGECRGSELPTFIVNPLRDRPPEPRVVKRRPKSYDLMTQPREQLRKSLLRQHLATN